MKASPCIAIVDCNSFFASCEQLAEPELRNRPVAVLSSNDGCIIARTDEVKALGIPMGVPYFKVRDLLAQHGVAVRSSNFDFYVDVSARIMRLLQGMAPTTEPYSIDEAFLDLTGMQRFHDLEAFAHQVRKRILEEVGIPVSIGLAPTKVLAKVANRLAKKRKTYVELLFDADITARTLAAYPVEDVWGIGRRTAEKLYLRGVRTAGDLIEVPDALILKLCSVTELRVVRELRGVPSIPIVTEYAPKKHIGTSRSFAKDIASFDELREAISYFVMFASVKLRQQYSVAGSLYVFARTNRHRKHHLQASLGHLVRLPVPTDHTPELMRAAERALRTLYRPGLQYKKAGILFLDIAPADAVQAQLFAPLPNPRRSCISRVADDLNRRFGKHTLDWAVYHGPDKRWMPLSEYRSKPLDMHVTHEERQRVRVWW